MTFDSSVAKIFQGIYSECKKWKINCPPKVKVEPALLFSSFMHNSSVKKLKNLKLSEHICYEVINSILYYSGFENNL